MRLFRLLAAVTTLPCPFVQALADVEFRVTDITIPAACIPSDTGTQKIEELSLSIAGPFSLNPAEDLTPFDFSAFRSFSFRASKVNNGHRYEHSVKLEDYAGDGARRFFRYAHVTKNERGEKELWLSNNSFHNRWIAYYRFIVNLENGNVTLMGGCPKEGSMFEYPVFPLGRAKINENF